MTNCLPVLKSSSAIDEWQRHDGVVSLERSMFRSWLGFDSIQGKWLVLSQSNVMEMMESIENVCKTWSVASRLHTIVSQEELSQIASSHTSVTILCTWKGRGFDEAQWCPSSYSSCGRNPCSPSRLTVSAIIINLNNVYRPNKREWNSNVIL